MKQELHAARIDAHRWKPTTSVVGGCHIESAAKEVRPKLRQLRSIIREVAPKAEERISYGMPYYEYKGRLAYFAAFKNHVSIFLTPPVIEQHRSELKGYITRTGTIQFPNDKPLPVALLGRLVRARVKLNDSRTLKK